MPIVTTKGQPIEVTTVSGYPVVVQAESGGLTTIDYPHHEIHEGNHYVASHTADLGNGATINFVIVTPDSTVEPHTIFNIITESESDGLIYEGVTYDAPGTGIATINRNRRSDNTADVLVYHTPTSPVTAGATVIQRAHWGSGRGAGGEVSGSAEFILKRDTAYMVSVTNSTTSNNYITFWIDWYEHDD